MITMAAMVAVVAALAGPAEFREANEAFLQGKYDRSIELYNGIISSGCRCADVHYNLGNAYLASGRRGMAVLHYERALQIDPSDADAAVNIELAKKPLLSEPAFTPSLKSPVEDFFRKVPPDPVSAAALAAWALTFILLLLGRLIVGNTAGKILGAALVASVLAALVSCTLLAGTVWVREYKPRCVVLSDSAELKEGPSVSFKSVIGLKEGLTVGLKGRDNGWYHIVLPSGVTGWVRTDSVEKI